MSSTPMSMALRSKGSTPHPLALNPWPRGSEADLFVDVAWGQRQLYCSMVVWPLCMQAWGNKFDSLEQHKLSIFIATFLPSFSSGPIYFKNKYNTSIIFLPTLLFPTYILQWYLQIYSILLTVLFFWINTSKINIILPSFFPTLLFLTYILQWYIQIYTPFIPKYKSQPPLIQIPRNNCYHIIV